MRLDSADGLTKTKNVMGIGLKLTLGGHVRVVDNVENAVRARVNLDFSKVQRCCRELHIESLCSSFDRKRKFVAAARRNSEVVKRYDFGYPGRVRYNYGGGGTRRQIALKLAKFYCMVFFVVAEALDRKRSRHLAGVANSNLAPLCLADQQSLKVDRSLVERNEWVLADGANFEGTHQLSARGRVCESENDESNHHFCFG